MKKEIVFVERVPSIVNLKFARALKLTGKYKTTLISFSKVDENLYKKAFDKILIFELEHKIHPKKIIQFFKKISSKEARIFLKKIRKLNPYVFHITGPDLFTMIFMFLIKKERPKIYFAYDIWEFSTGTTGGFRMKKIFQKIFEKISFKKAHGVLHKGPSGELNFLRYKIGVPDLAITPDCLDEWIYPPKRGKRKKELHVIYPGGPLTSEEGRIPFIKIVKTVTSQKIHFHTYGPCVQEKDNNLFFNEEKINKYFHFHKREKPEELNKKISKYNYGIFPDFYDATIINPIWPKTSMAGKMFNYIEAGLPTIINRQSEVMSDIVKENKIGILIDYSDLKNLKKIIQQQNYEKLQQNVKKAQEKFRLSKNIKKLEDFYKKIVNLKHQKNKIIFSYNYLIYFFYPYLLIFSLMPLR